MHDNEQILADAIRVVEQTLAGARNGDAGCQRRLVEMQHAQKLHVAAQLGLNYMHIIENKHSDAFEAVIFREEKSLIEKAMSLARSSEPFPKAHRRAA